MKTTRWIALLLAAAILTACVGCGAKPKELSAEKLAQWQEQPESEDYCIWDSSYLIRGLLFPGTPTEADNFSHSHEITLRRAADGTPDVIAPEEIP